MTKSCTDSQIIQSQPSGIFVYILMYIGHELQGLYNPKETYIFFLQGWRILCSVHGTINPLKKKGPEIIF